jgi:hypothetical protein
VKPGLNPAPDCPSCRVRPTARVTWMDVTLWLDWPGHLVVRPWPWQGSGSHLVGDTWLQVTCTQWPRRVGPDADSLVRLAVRAGGELSDWLTVVGRHERPMPMPRVLWLHVWNQAVIRSLIHSQTPWTLQHRVGCLWQVSAVGSEGRVGGISGDPARREPCGMSDRPSARRPPPVRSTSAHAFETACRGRTLRAGNRVPCRHPTPNVLPNALLNTLPNARA